MKQSIGSVHGSGSCSDTFAADEIEVAETLTRLFQLILESEGGRLLPSTWGCKRRRSDIRVSSVHSPVGPSSLTPSPPLQDGGGVVGPTTDEEGLPLVKAQASSPATPLLFSPSESDEKPKRKSSLKRKLQNREDYLKIFEERTKSRDLLLREIENVKRYYDQLKAYNSKLKAKREELIASTKGKKPCSKITFRLVRSPVNKTSMAENEDQQLPAVSQLPCGQFQIGETSVEILENASSQATTSLRPTSGDDVLGMASSSMDMGTGGIPDLNISLEESVVHVDSSGPLEPIMTDKDLMKIMAAQARRKRYEICRLKNTIGINKPRYCS